MKTKLILFVGILYSTISAHGAIETEMLTVHFNHDEHQLTLEAKVMLRSFMLPFDPNDDLEVEIYGHTDVKGSDAYNMNLAERRSASVRAYLLELGFHDLEAQIHWLGKRAPVVRSNNHEAHARNRRVELVVRKYEFESLAEVRQFLGQQNKHRFEIDPQETTTVTCQRGSTVTIAANTLVYANGEPCTDKVTVEVVEALNPLDFFTEKLSTRSGDELLISGGMLNINAYDAEGRPLELAEGADIRTSIPAETVDPEMQLFTSTDGSDWALTGNQIVPSSNNYAPSFLLEKPTINFPAFRAPPMKLDIGLKPVLPPFPQCPVEPTQFTTQMRTVYTRWWQYRKRSQLRKSNKLIVPMEVENPNYARQMERYGHRYRRYQQDSASYNSRLEKYEVRFAIWEAKRDSAVRVYKEVIYPAALDSYNARVAETAKYYNVDLENWYEEALSEIVVVTNEDTQANNDVRQYLFAANSLGWLNCDKFWAIPEQNIIALNIEVERNDVSTTFIVFKNERSMIATWANASGQFARIPKNSEGSIISCYVEDGRLQVGFAELSDEEQVKLEYKPIKLSQFAKFVNSHQLSELAMN